MEVSTLQQCSAEAAAEESEALQQADISDFDSDDQGNGVVEEGELSNGVTAVLEEEHSEHSGGEELLALSVENPAPRERQFVNCTDVTNDLLIRQLCDVVTEMAGSYEASARAQDQSLNHVS
ncbi:hypothetical protein scyTo_0006536 [Scyliorhinus torazame]|uniref:Uncharacterized protein n=1 Tax=Scyliorhinus torazame TaxID=75743 RepID=A0A401PIJ2_SCYTO|nr:hypothetical protein [Scyliorhinus torazame]